jgi:acetyltransferase EpsM
MASQPVLILSARPFAAEVADLVSEMPGLHVAGFVENLDRQRCQETLEGLPIYWVDDVAGMAQTHLAVCALGSTHRRRYVEQVAALGMRYVTVVHPQARVSAKSTVGEGSIISVGAIIAAHTRLGRHVFVNRGALVGHHVEVGDYATIGPGANIAGSCRIGEASYIGMGAMVLDHLTVGAHAIVGAGAVVTRDVPDNVQVLGVPARIVKENIAGK